MYPGVHTSAFVFYRLVSRPTLLNISDIGGMVFFEQLLKDGAIKPDLGDGCLHEDDVEFWTARDSSPPRQLMILEIMIFLKILTIDQAMNSLQKQLQRGVNIHSKTESRMLKILSPIISPKMIFHAQKWNCHHTPDQNGKNLTPLNADALSTTLSQKKGRLHII